MAMPKEEFSRREQYYAAIAGRNGVKPDFPFSREEEYLEAIDEYLDTKADLVNGKVPASQLPSYVDDVLEFQDIEHFPATGELGKIYVALDTNETYRWSGSTYIQVGGGAPQLIATKVVDTNSADDQNNPELFFPTLTQLHPGHYYFVTEIIGHYGPGNTCNGVIEFTLFNTLDTPGLSEIHFGGGSLAFWQDTNTPPPTGTSYIEDVTSTMQTMYDTNNNWGTDVIFDNAYNAQFNDGAIIKVYYKPL